MSVLFERQHTKFSSLEFAQAIQISARTNNPKQHVLEVLLGVAMRRQSNYTNSFSPFYEAFKPDVWQH